MVAVAGGRVGGIVTADQRRIWNVEVVAGVVANLGIAKGLVIVEVGANHLEEQAGRTIAGRVGRVARPQPSVGRPVAIALVEFDGDHLPGTEGAASRKGAGQPFRRGLLCAGDYGIGHRQSDQYVLRRTSHTATSTASVFEPTRSRKSWSLRRSSEGATVMPLTRSNMVGVTGFEPATSSA